MRPSSLGGGRILRRTLSVRPVIVYIRTSVTCFRQPCGRAVSFVLFTCQGRIPYGDLSRTSLFLIMMESYYIKFYTRVQATTTTTFATRPTIADNMHPTPGYTVRQLPLTQQNNELAATYNTSLHDSALTSDTSTATYTVTDTVSHNTHHTQAGAVLVRSAPILPVTPTVSSRTLAAAAGIYSKSCRRHCLA